MLWTALSRTVRAPSRLDRDPYIPSNRASPPWLLAGGPGIDAEVARVFEVGYRGQPTPSTNLTINWYRSLYNNLHTQEVSATRDYLVFAGRMRGAISGLEAWGSYQPLSNWRLSTGFAGLYQRFALDAGSTDTVSLPQARGKDPAQTWLLRSSWDAPHGHQFDLTVRHVSRLHTPEVPSYAAIDVRWGWRATPTLELSLVGRNIFDDGHGEYTAIATRAEIGQSVSIQAVASF
jgi:iron complex outermembrane receptor protein